MEGHFNLKAIAGLSADACARFGAPRRARPACPWFDARSLVGRPQTKVDFVGRFAMECCVRPVPVVPRAEGIEVSTKACSAR